MKRTGFVSRSIVTRSFILLIFLTVALPGMVSGQSDTAVPAFEKTTVTTPRGSSVEATIYTGTISAAPDSGIEDYWAERVRAFDGQIVSGPTDAYNCHGYTWYMSEEGGGQVHIEDPRAYREDGSYTQIEVFEAAKGDKVLYGDGIHSGVVADEPGWVISKWGDGPLVKHRLRDVPPEFGADLELTFFRKVPTLSPPSNLRIVIVGE